MAGEAARGTAVYEACVANLPPAPGVYRMIGADGDVLYVGKARNLKKRVACYASPGRLGPRLHRMVADTASDGVRHHRTEAEALLLESNLIKRLTPALQHLAARRQVVRLHPRHRRSSFPACSSTAARSRAGRLLRPVRLGLGGQPDTYRVAAGLSCCAAAPIRCSPPHPALPAASDQAVLGALRRADRRGGLRRPGGRGARLPEGRYAAVQRDLAADGDGQRGSRFRGSGAHARPDPGADRGSVASGHQP